VHGTGSLASRIPEGSDIVAALNNVQSGLGDSLRGAIFESVFGDNYPIFNKAINVQIPFIATISGRLESGVANGIATFSIKDFRFSSILGTGTIVFDDVELVGESTDIIKSDVNFDANGDLILLNSKTKQVQVAYLDSVAYLGGSAKKGIVSALSGAKIPSGFSIVGTADFDLDGNVDFLLFNSKSGQTQAITTNLEKLKTGAMVTSLIAGPTLASGFKVGGIGDFNLDGNWDILAYNPKTLATVEFILNKGMGLIGTQAGPTIPKGTEVVSVSDFNDDSTSDLLLFNPKTRASSAILLGSVPVTVKGPTLPKDWIIIGSTGFDNNRSIDLLIYNAKKNQVQFYLNKGAIFSSLPSKPGKSLTIPAGLAVVGPR